jgi:hypothetical protein
MSSSRARAALAVGSVCLFLLLLLLPQLSPAPVKAAWDPKITSGAQNDPGTPFEEPEGGDPGNTQGPAGRPASASGSQQPAPTSSAASGAVKIVVRQLVLPRLVLILWHLQ